MGDVMTGDGLRLRMYEDGAATNPTVLLVHGFPDTAAVWEPLVRELKDSFRVVRYDVRGMGGSEAPATREGYRIERLKDDVIRVAEAAGGKVHLVGHDWGAVQGWRAVQGHPFESFTAISGPDLGHASDWYRRNFPSRETVNQLIRSWYMAAFKTPRLPDLIFPTPGLELYRANIGREHEAKRITTRTLQIVATRDRFVTPAMVRAAEPWCDDLTVKIVPAGHWVIKTHPEITATWIKEFTRES
ncbi:alpha/beta fold hydrolase [Kutzneria sp. 744]|uniref:alpha/beta fold hydrolase n=1 Tax=Kutzneria sp. (strain 744) TaxID=345341 RepID=UPI0003EED746|nr:alpha/beta fold hydrolase [Kutzneria sp. 744]EWM16070.1 alpha/beta hydrolase [Kutzneria sp. 744]